MAATTLTAMPSVFTAGDTLLLLIDGGDYPADQSWVLTYDFRQANGNNISFSSTASGSNHSFNVAQATTNAWLYGFYKGSASVTNGTQTFTVWEGFLEVKPAPSQQGQNYDPFPWYFAARDKMRLVVSGKAGRDIINSTIAGQNIARLTPDQAIAFLNYLEQQCSTYIAQLNAEAGKGAGNMVLIRFGQAK